MQLTKIALDDVSFVLACLKELSGNVSYSEQALYQYLNNSGAFGDGPYQILIAQEDGVRLGMLTCNRYSIPRYLGYGIELEEVVILPEFQGKGIAGRMIEGFIRQMTSDVSLRKITVRTDDRQKAKRVYARYFSETDQIVFARMINKL